MSSAVADLAQQVWPHGTGGDDESYRKALRDAAQAMLVCRRRLDPAACNQWLNAIQEVGQYATVEPRISAYAGTLGLATITLADWLVSQHRFEEALKIISTAWSTLDARDVRRAAAGLAPTKSIRGRVSLLGILCDAKWRMPFGDRSNVVVTPTQHVDTWLMYATRMPQVKADILAGFAEASPGDQLKKQKEARVITEALLWSGLWVACVALRYCRRALVGHIQAYNQLHQEYCGSAGLALEERHWQIDLPLIIQSPLYWQFEISKQWLAHERAARSARPARRPALTLDELEELYSRLRSSATHWTQDRRDEAYETSIELDYQWIKSALQRAARRKTLAS